MVRWMGYQVEKNADKASSLSTQLELRTCGEDETSLLDDQGFALCKAMKIQAWRRHDSMR